MPDRKTKKEWERKDRKLYLWMMGIYILMVIGFVIAARYIGS